MTGGNSETWVCGTRCACARLLEYRHVALARIPLSESKYFSFRWDVYNALNHQNLGIPNYELLPAAQRRRLGGRFAPIRLPVREDYQRADRSARDAVRLEVQFLTEG